MQKSIKTLSERPVAPTWSEVLNGEELVLDAKPKTRSQSVTETLRDLILEAKVKPGQHLEERPLAHALGVSRTPLRAALSTLATEGILEYRPLHGYVVREFDHSDVLNAWQMRAWLEGLIALKAAQNGLTEEQKNTIRKALDQGDVIVAVGRLRHEDLETYRTMNFAIHDTLIKAAASSLLEETIRRILSHPMLSYRVIPWDDFDHIQRCHGDHHRLFEAVVAGEQWRAEAIMREHVYSATRVLGRIRSRLGSDRR